MASRLAGGAPIPWDRLRAWIDKQEADEAACRREKRPSPLSLQQFQALSLLVDLWEDDEPASDGMDHVSSLNLLIQKRGYKPAIFKELEPLDVYSAGVYNKRWRTVCILPHATDFPRGFPAPGHGIDDEAKGVPSFKSKKSAKQYAAKHAYAYLVDGPSPAQRPKISHAPQPTPPTRAPQPPRPNPSPAQVPRPSSEYGSASEQETDDEEEQSSAMTYHRSEQNATSTSTSRSSTTAAAGHGAKSASPPSASSDFALDDGASLVARVAHLTAALGLECPSYQLVEEDMPGWFTGFAAFHRQSPVPAKCRVVRGVLGKAKAKEELAKRILRWLEGEQAKRESVLAGMLGGEGEGEKA